MLLPLLTNRTILMKYMCFCNIVGNRSEVMIMIQQEREVTYCMEDMWHLVWMVTGTVY